MGLQGPPPDGVMGRSQASSIPRAAGNLGRVGVGSVGRLEGDR